MFTGIIETVGVIKSIRNESSNRVFTIQSPFTSELKVDQSIAHDGVCLTVTDIHGDEYSVVAIEETLSRTHFHALKEGSQVNLERSMKLGDRLDGHIVQGHVDETARCKKIDQQNGSWLFAFEYDPSSPHVTVEKGSICINGVSLTVVESGKNRFTVAIIPYTYEHTNFHLLNVNDEVNLEFDIIGKYISRLVKERT